MATVDDILRVTLNFDISGNSIGNLVHHFRVVASTSTDYVQIATDINTALAAAYLNAMDRISNQVSPISLELAEWDYVDSEWDGKASVIATTPDGLATGDPLPAPVAAVIRWPTEELRRQARKFLPGIMEVDSQVDSMSAASLTDFALSGALLNNDVSADGLTLRPCTFNDTPLSPRFETWSDFSTTSIVNLVYGYQRRRKVGVGI